MAAGAWAGGLVVVMMILGVLAAIGGVIWLAIHLRNQKIARFQALADKYGWEFKHKCSDEIVHYGGFKPFGIGHSQNGAYMLRGSHDGRAFSVFRYQYTTGSGKNQTTHVHRVFEMATPLAGRDLYITREHFGHKIFDALGGEDIDFESDEFSRRFWVQCPDRRFAYDVITPRMMEFLLQTGKGMWQWKGHRLVYVETGTLKVGHVEPVMAMMDAFLDRLPRHRLAESRSRANA